MSENCGCRYDFAATTSKKIASYHMQLYLRTLFYFQFILFTFLFGAKFYDGILVEPYMGYGISGKGGSSHLSRCRVFVLSQPNHCR